MAEKQVKRKMQNVSFRNLEELLEFLPEDEKEILLALRHLIKDCIPHIKEKLSYNVPFYRYSKSICYIWPGSVPWGNVTFSGVQFGFTRGHLLADELKYLEIGNRKYIRTKKFQSIADIDFDLLRAYLFEAWEIDGD
jgi:hypothetical protein